MERDFTPNAETLAAMEEADDMIKYRRKNALLRKVIEEVRNELFSMDFSNPRIRACFIKLRDALKEGN